MTTKESGVVLSTKDAGAGTYRVYFDRNISTCTYQATAGNTNDAPEDINLGFQGNTIDGGGLTNNGVFVQTANAAGTLTDSGFHLAVFC